jgi:Protein of unknown function (DUF2924)
MGAAVYREIARLPGLDAKALRQRYREVFGEEPRTTQRQQLVRRIGWKLQALSQGDISEAARRRALQIAQDREVGIHLPSAMVPVAPLRRGSADARLPVPGTELRRPYRDRVVVAKVLVDGFEYENRHFRSLSAVARAATGTRWNGWLFFGLTGDPAQQERA